MGLCVSGQKDDYKDIVRYDGRTFLGFRHGEGTYLYQNGDMYKGEWKWNQKHGHGVYTHKNGEVKQGFFYYDEYIGNEPGDLFAATTCTCTCLGRGSSAEPLMSDEEKRNQERLEEARQRMERHEKKREERQQRRDEMRKKYNL